MFRSDEQKHFSDLVAKHIAEMDAPLLLEGGTGLGKTRAYLAALASYSGTVAIVLPTHQLIEQLLASSDLRAVIPNQKVVLAPLMAIEKFWVLYLYQ